MARKREMANCESKKLWELIWTMAAINGGDDGFDSLPDAEVGRLFKTAMDRLFPTEDRGE